MKCCFMCLDLQTIAFKKLYLSYCFLVSGKEHLLIKRFSLPFLPIFTFTVTSITCVSRHLRCPSHLWSPCQGQVITMWWTTRAPLNTTCPVLHLSQLPVDGQGGHRERKMSLDQVRDFKTFSSQEYCYFPQWGFVKSR